MNIVIWTIESQYDTENIRKEFYESIYNNDLIKNAFWKKELIDYIENKLNIKKYIIHIDHLLFKFEINDEKLYNDIKNKKEKYNKINNYKINTFITKSIEYY